MKNKENQYSFRISTIVLNIFFYKKKICVSLFSFNKWFRFIDTLSNFWQIFFFITVEQCLFTTNHFENYNSTTLKYFNTINER